MLIIVLLALQDFTSLTAPATANVPKAILLTVQSAALAIHGAWNARVALITAHPVNIKGPIRPTGRTTLVSPTAEEDTSGIRQVAQDLLSANSATVPANSAQGKPTIALSVRLRTIFMGRIPVS